ncbi:MAG: DUF4317 domain-containing protein [Lachnospiraceae bacterium]|nr:DUF4317 domain-containing protein [Lachnospiraceae bacterium]
MVKPELNELKKLFTPKKCSINRICGCYVDGEKNVKTTFAESFLNLPEDETFKYFEIMRKVLSGSIGKTALNMEFPTETEQESGTQEFLYRLRQSTLKDESLVYEFFDKVIEHFEYVGNYLILLIHDTYDVPGKTTDGIINEDASDTVFDYILCAICPVNLTKPALSYDNESNGFHNRIRDWIVEMPETGFLFPAFNQRAADIHSIMYYVKDSEELYDELLDAVLGCVPTLTAKAQKESFQVLIGQTLDDEADFETVNEIYSELTKLEAEHKEQQIAEPLTLDKISVKKLFEQSGVNDEKMKTFDKVYDETVGEDTELFAGNIHALKTIEVKTPDIVIKVNPERADLIHTKVIDGRKCLVIEMNDNVELNGLDVTL